MVIQTTVGRIELEVDYGWDRRGEQWVSPARVSLGLATHERMSPVLGEKLAYTATRTGSYEKAAEVARKWGAPADDATIHRRVQEAGQEAIEQIQRRVERAFPPSSAPPTRAGQRSSESAFSLVLMMDGWMIRERGPQWGLKPPEQSAARVDWHEVKTAVLFRVEDQTRKDSGRGLLVRKFMVTWRGGPEEFGRQLYAEALRRGLHEAGRLFVVADGGVWIWNLTAEHFPQAEGVLDFYHAVQP